MSRAYTWTFFGGHLEKMHGTDLTLNCRPKNSLDLESAQNLALKKHRFKKMSMICPTLPLDRDVRTFINFDTPYEQFFMCIFYMLLIAFGASAHFYYADCINCI